MALFVTLTALIGIPFTTSLLMYRIARKEL